MIEPFVEPGLITAVALALPMWALYRSCPICRAAPGKACAAMNGSVAGGQPDGVRTPLQVAHAARKRKGRAS